MKCHDNLTLIPDTRAILAFSVPAVANSKCKKNLEKMTPFGATGKIAPGSIVDIGYLRLGGIDEWVMIRRKSVANSTLIFLLGVGAFGDVLFHHLIAHMAGAP